MLHTGIEKENVKSYLQQAGQRHWAWISRTRKNGATWRPRRLHRAAACNWLANLDKRYSFYTDKPGLVHFKPKWGTPLWDNWRTMPRAVPGLDFGSDGVSGLHAGQFRKGWQLSLEGFPDQSHQGNCAVYNCLKSVGLCGLVVVCCELQCATWPRL